MSKEIINNDNPQKSKTAYWYQRLHTDTEKLSDDKKLALIRTLLTEYINVTLEELDIFTAPGQLPGIEDVTNVMTFSSTERKVARFFGSSSFPEGSEESDINRTKYLDSFRSVLRGFYTESELDDLVACMVPDDEILATMWLVGNDHYMVRRIRNAYLPTIFDLLVATPNGLEDFTHTLFDSDREPVDEIEDLLKSLGNS